jgi:hypothetical protein
MDRRRSDYFVRLLHAPFHEKSLKSNACGARHFRGTSPDRAILDRLRETQDLVSGSKD